MNTASGQPPAIRRIVVTLESSEAGRPALDIALRLAAVAGAQLEGVFVENADLIRLSALPFLREVRPWSLAEEVVSTRRMQRDLRVLARQAEAMLMQASRAVGVGCSFRIWRGHTAEDLWHAATDADILSVRAGGSAPARTMIAARITRRQANATADTPVSVNVLLGESPASERALTTGCLLAAAPGARLRVLLPADSAAQPPAGVGDILSTCRQQAEFVQLADNSPAALATALRATDGNTVLVADSDHPLFATAGIGAWLQQLSGSVLLVR
jgi:nucleotide-binding universal stress UspA family protein